MSKMLTLLLVIVLAALPAFGGDVTGKAKAEPQQAPSRSFLSWNEFPPEGLWPESGSAGAAPAEPAEKAEKAPPLPPHTIEGVGGCSIVPMAYLVDPGPKGTVVGLPSVSFTYVNAGAKNIESVAVTQTFLRRFEFGYAINRFGMGTLPHAVAKATGVNIHRDAVYLHNFNLRALVIEENSFDLPLPAVTAGVHFKYNDGIRSVDNRLGGALSGIGFARSNGIDYTLTATKTFPTLLFGRPVLGTVGVRNSQGSQIGYLGFSDHCATTVEASAVCLPTDWLGLGYEFRQKTNPYDRINNLIGDEDNWHAVCFCLILGKHLTLSGGWGCFGNLTNSRENCGWALQLKCEF